MNVHQLNFFKKFVPPRVIPHTLLVLSSTFGGMPTLYMYPLRFILLDMESFQLWDESSFFPKAGPSIAE